MRKVTILIFALFSVCIWADDKTYKIGLSKPKPENQKPDACQMALAPDHILSSVDWKQPLLRDLPELRKIAELRSNSRLWPVWTRALEMLPKIKTAVDGASSEKRLYFENILKAVEAALTKHQMEFGKSRDLGRMDVPRHMAILSAIADFSDQRPEFSLYKIKRAIEGRYSLHQYTNCR